MKTTVRLAEERDAQQFVEWQQSTPENLFDPAIGAYPNLRTLVIEQDGKPALYVPFHPVLMVESLAHKPGITRMENARALKLTHETLGDLAKQYGIAEVWWGCKDETLIKFASNYGYEPWKYSMIRKKVGQ